MPDDPAVIVQQVAQEHLRDLLAIGDVATLEKRTPRAITGVGATSNDVAPFSILPQSRAPGLALFSG